MDIGAWSIVLSVIVHCVEEQMDSQDISSYALTYCALSGFESGGTT